MTAAELTEKEITLTEKQLKRHGDEQFVIGWNASIRFHQFFRRWLK